MAKTVTFCEELVRDIDRYRRWLSRQQHRTVTWDAAFRHVMNSVVSVAESAPRDWPGE